jgi:hypothetical protein
MSEDTDFFEKATNKTKEAEEKTSSEMIDDEMGSLKIKVPKPLFTSPTRCTIEEVKFYKMDTNEKNKNDDTEYTPFYVSVKFKEVGGKDREFIESYRGGRTYAKDGKITTYIGPDSAMGKLKAVCIDNKIDLGNTVKDWATGMVGKTAILKSDIVIFAGKKYEKNFVVAFDR